MILWLELVSIRAISDQNTSQHVYIALCTPRGILVIPAHRSSHKDQNPWGIGWVGAWDQNMTLWGLKAKPGFGTARFSPQFQNSLTWQWMFACLQPTGCFLLWVFSAAEYKFYFRCWSLGLTRVPWYFHFCLKGDICCLLSLSSVQLCAPCLRASDHWHLFCWIGGTWKVRWTAARESLCWDHKHSIKQLLLTFLCRQPKRSIEELCWAARVDSSCRHRHSVVEEEFFFPSTFTMKN